MLYGRFSAINPEVMVTVNVVRVGADGSLSLFSLVVPPGSETPIHDHLAWGLDVFVMRSHDALPAATSGRCESGFGARRPEGTMTAAMTAAREMPASRRNPIV
jgi:hypothetical protein